MTSLESNRENDPVTATDFPAPADPTKRLENESIGKLLIGYSLPAIAGMIIISLYNIIDSIFIGHGVGPMALTGLAVAFPLMNLQMASCLLVAVGAAAVSSIELGRKNTAGAFGVLGHAVILSIVMGIVFGALSLTFLDDILFLFGASPESLPYARDFMEIVSLSAPIFFLMLALNNVCRASGYPQRAMFSSVISVAVNIVLAPVFIFLLDWGIRGAALATVCAQTAGLVWLLRHFLNPASVLHLKRGIFRLKPAVVKSILAIGLSPFLMNVCACIIVIVINISLRDHGGDLAVGAFGLLNRILMLFAMTIVGLTHGMQPIIGYNFGAGQARRVKDTLRYGVIAATSVTTFGFLLVHLCPGLLAGMFTSDPALTDLTIRALKISSAAFFLVGGQIVIASYFQFIGKVAVATFLSLSRQMLFLLPCLIILPGIYGVTGVWMSLPIADVVATVVTVVLLRWSLKKKHLERGMCATENKTPDMKC